MSDQRHPLQNRVTPFGEIVATPERGTLMGNRGGRLHRDDRTLGPARWRSKAWIACRLAFRGRRREVMGAGYTELFFLDEATALAAGHRPCFECRRTDARAFQEAWAHAHGLAHAPRAGEMDAVLHRERLGPRAEVAVANLPEGAMVAEGGEAFLVLSGATWRWTPAGYVADSTRERAVLLTPPSIVAVLGAGYQAVVHASVGS